MIEKCDDSSSSSICEPTVTLQVPCETCSKRGCASICPNGADNVLLLALELKFLMIVHAIQVPSRPAQQKIGAFEGVTFPFHSRLICDGRYILANTEELHAQINTLTIRVRELEHGLSTLQATVSSEPHPLLEGRGSSSDPSLKDATDENMTGSDEENVIEAFGMFTHFCDDMLLYSSNIYRHIER